MYVAASAVTDTLTHSHIQNDYRNPRAYYCIDVGMYMYNNGNKDFSWNM